MSKTQNKEPKPFPWSKIMSNPDELDFEETCRMITDHNPELLKMKPAGDQSAFELIRDNNVKGMLELYEEGYNVNEIDAIGDGTLLHHVIELRSIEMLLILLADRRLDPTITDKNNRAPIVQNWTEESEDVFIILINDCRVSIAPLFEPSIYANESLRSICQRKWTIRELMEANRSNMAARYWLTKREWLVPEFRNARKIIIEEYLGGCFVFDYEEIKNDVSPDLLYMWVKVNAEQKNVQNAMARLKEKIEEPWYEKLDEYSHYRYTPLTGRYKTLFKFQKLLFRQALFGLPQPVLGKLTRIPKFAINNSTTSPFTLPWYIATEFIFSHDEKTKSSDTTFIDTILQGPEYVDVGPENVSISVETALSDRDILDLFVDGEIYRGTMAMTKPKIAKEAMRKKS